MLQIGPFWFDSVAEARLKLDTIQTRLLQSGNVLRPCPACPQSKTQLGDACVEQCSPLKFLWALHTRMPDSSQTFTLSDVVYVRAQAGNPKFVAWLRRGEEKGLSLVRSLNNSGCSEKERKRRGNKDWLNQALRNEVREQLTAFRMTVLNEAKRTEQPYVCPLTETIIPLSSLSTVRLDVDHIGLPFTTLVQNWLEGQEKEPCLKWTSGSPLLKEPSVALSWRKYHHSHAKFQLVLDSANRSKGVEARRQGHVKSCRMKEGSIAHIQVKQTQWSSLFKQLATP